MKKIGIIFACIFALAALTACSVNITAKNEKTNITEDENGNQVIDSTIEEFDNGSFTEEVVHDTRYDSVPFKMTNDSDIEWHELYVAPSDQDSWGNDLLDGEVVSPGENITSTFSFTESQRLWDIKIIDDEGNDYTFSKFDMGKSTKDNIEITIKNKEEGGYTAVLDTYDPEADEEYE